MFYFMITKSSNGVVRHFILVKIQLITCTYLFYTLTGLYIINNGNVHFNCYLFRCALFLCDNLIVLHPEIRIGMKCGKYSCIQSAVFNRFICWVYSLSNWLVLSGNIMLVINWLQGYVAVKIPGHATPIKGTKVYAMYRAHGVLQKASIVWKPVCSCKELDLKPEMKTRRIALEIMLIFVKIC